MGRELLETRTYHYNKLLNDNNIKIVYLNIRVDFWVIIFMINPLVFVTIVTIRTYLKVYVFQKIIGKQKRFRRNETGIDKNTVE